MLERPRQSQQDIQKDRRRLRRAFRRAAILTLAVGLVFALMTILGWSPGLLGVRPRSVEGLAGIAAMPLLHGGWEHLLSNLPPLFMMSLALFWLFPSVATRVLLVSWVLPPALVWLLAAGGNPHIGASGLTFALFGFLALSGLIRRQAPALAVSLLTLFYYGGMLSGLIPDTPGVSWQSHLAGFVTGIVLAIRYRHRDRPPQRVYDWELEDEADAGAASDALHRDVQATGMPDSGHKH